MKDSQYYGGSAQEAKEGRRAFELRERCRKYGFTVRHERGRVVIVPGKQEVQQMFKVKITTCPSCGKENEVYDCVAKVICPKCKATYGC